MVVSSQWSENFFDLFLLPLPASRSSSLLVFCWFSSMPATNYVVTVQRPTAVSAIATGNFTSSTDHNLIVAKNTYLDIYLIDSEGLKLVKDVPIYGRINILRCFRLPVIRDRWSFSLFFVSSDRIWTKMWYSFWRINITAWSWTVRNVNINTMR